MARVGALSPLFSRIRTEKGQVAKIGREEFAAAACHISAPQPLSAISDAKLRPGRRLGREGAMRSVAARRRWRGREGASWRCVVRRRESGFAVQRDNAARLYARACASLSVPPVRFSFSACPIPTLLLLLLAGAYSGFVTTSSPA